MATLVIDSNIVIANFIPVAYSASATQFLQSQQRNGSHFIAPTLFLYEITAVVRKCVVQKLITDAQGQNALDSLLSYPVQYLVDTTLAKRAYALAAQFNRPTAYDSQYLALAEREHCEFWTADEKLFNVVSSTFAWVRWLGHYQPPTAEGE